MPSFQRALSVADLRRIARRRLPRFVFEFIDGGAEDEVTLRRNREALERIGFCPRVLTDVSQPRLSVDLMGAPARLPLVIAPMGTCTLAARDADLALARAAAAAGIPYTLSTMSSTSLEDMARAVAGRLWFQLYVLRNRDFNDALVTRADDAGYEALVVTVDLATGGKRERDLRNGITIPLRLGLRGMVDCALRPGWSLRMLRDGSPVYRNLRGLFDNEEPGLTIAHKVGRNLDAAFDLDALARLRDRWPRKLVVKGVQHPSDAERVAGIGVDAVWVSNHGGRQLDGAEATIDSLPRIARAVGGRLDVIVDSGIRRGSDVLKAAALGATAAAIGRPALFAASAGGEAGVAHAIGIFEDELRRAMQLAGVADIADIDPSIVAPEREAGRNVP